MEIIGIAAISLDGFITKHAEEGAGFTSEADQHFFTNALKQFDCCIFGSKTFLADQAGIVRGLSPERLRIVLTRSPEKYAAYQQPGMLEFSNASPREVIADLQRRNKQRCAVLGGGAIYAEFLAPPLLDELWITVEPLIFGTGKPLAQGQMDVSLALKEVVSLSENTLLLKYTTLRKKD